MRPSLNIRLFLQTRVIKSLCGHSFFTFVAILLFELEMTGLQQIGILKRLGVTKPRDSDSLALRCSLCLVP